ncbi:hypothetical protein OG497_37800 [Streptomyces sp. NBC_01242]|uniref:hypothetical protein n=1 Tax=Streptomyces sp. NBC_01242 TaxID=2903795 RepID=UPI00224F459F|nr:hypothetical protein [Streptomyces sp. NBC_01242]MCX4799613.1 hypothetical protein [Streptomyces sp. NBC_01242]
MPRPKIGSLYAVYANRLNIHLASNGRAPIPVRLLSGTDWALPKTPSSIQPHQASPVSQFIRPDYWGHNDSLLVGRLICWAEGEERRHLDIGPLAATGPAAWERLRALPAPNLRKYNDYLYGVLRDARMHIDVIDANELTDLIAEEN